jgi:hypothetical protein
VKKLKKRKKIKKPANNFNKSTDIWNYY